MCWRLVLVFLLGCNAFCAASAQHRLSFSVSRTLFTVTQPDNELSVSDSELQSYIERGADAIIRYFGAFPLKHVNINIRAVGGNRVRFGRSSPEDGGTILLLIGREARNGALIRDWTLTHEMVHLAFPALKGDNHDWLQEGMATYVEPIARAQAGYLTEEYVWNQFVNFMPKGEPAAGDRGLDNTPTWRRVYWGGALFCLVADIEIRKETHNHKGLQDAFRAIMDDKGAKDGTMEWEWPIDSVLEMGDHATGTHVLQRLYAEWKDKPVNVDLGLLWRELGVEKKDNSVIFDENAPLALVRKAIISAQ